MRALRGIPSWRRVGVLLGAWAFAAGVASAAEPPAIAGQVTFLYYHDLPAAARFYGGALGLTATLDLDWVKIYRLSETASVGLVDGAAGALKPAADKPVMLSLVVEDADAWYRYLVERGVEPPAPPSDSSRVPIRGFSFEDPEGYSVEVFAWREPAPRAADADRLSSPSSGSRPRPASR